MEDTDSKSSQIFPGQAPWNGNCRLRHSSPQPLAHERGRAQHRRLIAEPGEYQPVGSTVETLRTCKPFPQGTKMGPQTPRNASSQHDDIRKVEVMNRVQCGAQGVNGPRNAPPRQVVGIAQCTDFLGFCGCVQFGRIESRQTLVRRC